MTDHTFLELGIGKKILCKGKSINLPIVTADLTLRLDLTITSLLHDVDLILGINWLQAVHPLIDGVLFGYFYPPTLELLSYLVSYWVRFIQQVLLNATICSCDHRSSEH